MYARGVSRCQGLHARVDAFIFSCDNRRMAKRKPGRWAKYRALYAEGWTLAAIARRFRVTRQAVAQAIPRVSK
jgi:hypothetical protein